MKDKRILVVEDSRRLNDYVSEQLVKNKYDVTQAFCGQDAYNELKTNYFDLVILDLKLGDISGLSILKTIRLQNKTLPVMIVSSITEEETKIEGFRIGCDDYLTKPFQMTDMLIRVKRMIERSEQMDYQSAPVQDLVSAGPFEINVAMQTIKKNGAPIPMRKKFFDIMLFFVQHPNVAITFRNLYESVWNSEAPEDSVLESNLYVNINNLRKLIEDDPAEPKFIQSIRHVGYMFTLEG
ncbi:MAG: response regulator transcription factor [Treponema sp.]|nr:response regulator transcription factor [Treponema sp.]